MPKLRYLALDRGMPQREVLNALRLRSGPMEPSVLTVDEILSLWRLWGGGMSEAVRALFVQDAVMRRLAMVPTRAQAKGHG